MVEEPPNATLPTSYAHVAHGEVETQLGVRGYIQVDLGINEVFQEFFHSQAATGAEASKFQASSLYYSLFSSLIHLCALEDWLLSLP